MNDHGQLIGWKNVESALIYYIFSVCDKISPDRRMETSAQSRWLLCLKTGQKQFCIVNIDFFELSLRTV